MFSLKRRAVRTVVQQCYVQSDPSMSPNLPSSLAIVTGSAQGLGRVFAARLLAAGARVMFSTGGCSSSSSDLWSGLPVRL